MLAHADETDDSHAPSLTHPGCGIVPAALAMAEREHRNGTALLRAVALGYDVGARLSMSLDALRVPRGRPLHAQLRPDVRRRRGRGRARRACDQRQVRHVLSYTAQQASGYLVLDARRGAHREGLRLRRHAGAQRRRRRDHGCRTASPAVDDVFSGERNFFVAYESRRIGKAPQPNPGARSRHDLRNHEHQHQALVGGLADPGAARFAARPDPRRTRSRPTTSSSSWCASSHQGANTTDNRDMPDICMQHMCAVMLLDGIVTFESVARREAHERPQGARAARAASSCIGDDALTAAMPSRQGIVEIKLNDGRELKHHTKAVRGTAENPMTRAEVDEKCYHLIAPILGKARARKLCDAVWDLEKVNDVRALRPLLRA